MKKLASSYNAALWAMEREFRKVNCQVSLQIHELRHEVEREFGVASKVVANALGPILLWTTRREERRLKSGWTYEPPLIIERKNWGTAA
jgi:hypothetical protein